jgi:hypothetical protein
VIPRRIQLPGCLAQALGQLLPAVAWERVSFYRGIPWPFSLGDEDAITLTGGFSRVEICFRPAVCEPPSLRFFLLCAHELVHALQVQQSPAGGRGLGLLNAFIIHYLACFFAAGSALPHRGNFYEDEAYEYEGVLGGALHAVGRDRGSPCDAAGGPAPGFAGVPALARIDPRLIKRRAAARGPCAGGAAAVAAGLLAVLTAAAGAAVYGVACLASRLLLPPPRSER